MKPVLIMWYFFYPKWLSLHWTWSTWNRTVTLPLLLSAFIVLRNTDDEVCQLGWMCFLCLCLSAFDLVNIHLFHDASNLVAWEKSPSVYSSTRQKALGFVLDRWDNLLKAHPLSINACKPHQALMNYTSHIIFFHSRLRFLSNERAARL